MAIIIFDLFGTLIDRENYNYGKALQWLSDSYFRSRFTELQELSLKYKEKYKKSRQTSYVETSFLNQLIYLEKALGIKINDDLKSVELKFIRIFREEKLINGSLELLKLLKKNDYRIFVLTNSIFSGDNLEKHLESLGINLYIEKIFSSADIGYRKPSKEIFDYLIRRLGIKKTKEVFFVGDSIIKDYEGATQSGFTPILIGSNIQKNGLVFENMTDLLAYFTGFLSNGDGK